MTAWRKDRPRSQLAMRVDGKTVKADPHDTVASALIVSGHWAMRRTRKGAPRGPFCLIGMCQECVVEIDGCPNVRSCTTCVAEGMQIKLGLLDRHGLSK